MKIENTNSIRVLTPEKGMFLCNEKQKLVATIVYLGIEADETEWIEITQERKVELEALWNEEYPENKATEEDYQNALESLGVKFDE